MDWKYLFTSFDGRIGRQTYWMGILVFFGLGIVASILDLILGTQIGEDVGLIGAVVSIAMIYPAIALYAKRWHDRNKSGWWTLIGLIPIIGAIWMLVELGFLRGTEGSNDYGSDPLAA
jgi:uncharacterized membrane protein YhaH (DUF805 family)